MPSLSFLILSADYPEFLDWLYSSNPGLEEESYESQMRARNESLFGVADFYSRNLRILGHEARDIHVNNEHMQTAWANEHMVPFDEPGSVETRWIAAVSKARRTAGRPLRQLRAAVRPVLPRLVREPPWFQQILAAQIDYYKPDVLLNQAMDVVGAGLLEEMKSRVRLLIGQHAAAPLPEKEDFSCYDLVISSFQPTLDFFKRMGITGKLSRLGFEPTVLPVIDPEFGKRFNVTFIGGLGRIHSSRIELLDQLCLSFPQMKIWGPSVVDVPVASRLIPHYAGPAWGRDMYQLLHDSRITINHHGNVGPYANNCRLYEATGVGVLLVTDWKENLSELFEPDKEVVTYSSAEECIERVRYYLEHENERAAIARAGQERTLRCHTYQKRAEELVDIVKAHM